MMKRNIFLLLVILVFGVLLVTACSSNPELVEDDHAADEHMDDDDHDDGDEHTHMDPPTRI